jgi:hypothetical protein
MGHNWHDERLLLGIGFLIGAAVWLGWSLRLRGHSLLLRPDGVEVRYRDTVVWCPWALFNAEGPPLVPEGDDPRVAIILPVAPRAVPFVELRRHESPVAFGAAVRAPQFRLATPERVILSARYEVAASDLGILLLRLGNRLGRRLPAGTPPPEAYPAAAEAHDEKSGPDREGWYSLSLAELRFPPRCCDCGQATDATLRIPLDSKEVASRLIGPSRPAELAVPICPECQERLREAHERGGLRGLNAGAILGALGAACVALAQGERGVLPLAFAGLAGAAIGALLGFLLGNGLTRPWPLQFRRYRPEAGTLQVRFRDPHYADLVRAASSQRSRTNS